jgi:hypothetical protein
MRRVSLNTAKAEDAISDDDVKIMLMVITHPELTEPIRLSGDNTEVLEMAPPAIPLWGTRSKWQAPTVNADPLGEKFWFMALSTVLPGEQDDAPASASIIVENTSRRVIKLLRSFTGQADVKMAVVSASNLDAPEQEWHGLKLIVAEGLHEINLSLSKEPVSSEPWPYGRFNRTEFPVLYR